MTGGPGGARPGSRAPGRTAVGSRAAVVSVAQLAWQQPGERQRERTAAVAAAALRGGADAVVLPELAVPGYTTDATVLERFAEPLDGPVTRAWRAAAAATGGYVVGGFCERAGGKLYNTAVAVGAEGVVCHYRKAHLFAAEKDVLAPGDLGFPVAETRLGLLGLCVCYDLRFVEVARLLALQGAELVCVPTAWIGGYDRRQPGGDSQPGGAGSPDQVTGLLTQANLNQVFIAAASFAGDGGRFLGSSVIADPYGARLAGPLTRDQEEVATARADLEAVAAAQHRAPLIHPREDRRTDLYRIGYRGRQY
jgi:N-carbamoylputrescine amidase